jgi:hypothetical protein
MKRILVAFLVLVMVAIGCPAENTYDFIVTSESGEVLGSGKVHLPFKLGADGKGTADWEFTPTQVTSTNKSWERAKARLSAGKGKATAKCENAWFTLDFNPGWADDNVTMSWDLNTEKLGTLCFADFAGGHPCASFRISRPTKPQGSSK